MHTAHFLKYIAALFFGSLFSLHSHAVVVTGTATNVADVVAGADRWQLTYRLTGELPTNYAVSLMFPPSQYTDLAAVSAPPASLDAALIPGDPVGGFDGLLILTALSDFGAADSADYSIFFTLLGGLPFNAQSYEVTSDNFDVVDAGRFFLQVTPTNTVPEPPTWMLLGLGLAYMARRTMRPRPLR